MALPTPPAPTTSALAPETAWPLRCIPRTKPAPSNMSPSNDPSGRLSTALQAPAICAVAVSSSTSPARCHLVRHGDQRAVARW